MKNILSFTSVAVVGLFATCASAQSSVTLYGVMDANLRHVTTGASAQTRVEPDGILGSRFGFRGEESLGGDLKATFTLESAVKPDTGVAGSTTALFSRRSTVGLVSGSWGEVRLGRDATTSWNSVIAYDHFGTGLGSLTKLFVPTAVNASEIFGRRIDNAVSYFLPANLGGLSGQLQFAPGEGATSGQTHGVRLAYRAGDFTTSAAQTSIQVAGGQWKQSNLGASYDLGVVKLLGQYVATKNTVGVVTKENVWELGATMPVGAAGTLKLGFAKASGYAEATKPTVGFVQDLSKRTAVYTTYTQIKNDNGTAKYAVESAPAATAGLKQKSSGYEMGIRHTF
jgi:predicted porin